MTGSATKTGIFSKVKLKDAKDRRKEKQNTLNLSIKALVCLEGNKTKRWLETMKLSAKKN